MYQNKPDTFRKRLIKNTDRTYSKTDIYPERVKDSEYRGFYPISFEYLHPEIQLLKQKRGENTVVQFAAFMHGRVHPSTILPTQFIMVKSGLVWFSPLFFKKFCI